jgi:hypothetical protein
MASFYIKTKPYYTAGETVSGEVQLAVPASIGGCSGVSLRFTAFECIKWVSPHQIPQPSSSPIITASSAIVPASQPLSNLQHVDVRISQCRKSKFRSALLSRSQTVGYDRIWCVLPRTSFTR